MNRPNPYVGPRPLKEGEHLYGRSRELRRLTNLLMGERIVLLYSPSGAGKTSLIQAGLIPELQREGYRIIGPMRPGAIALAAEDETAAMGNRYVAAAIASQESGAAEARAIFQGERPHQESALPRALSLGTGALRAETPPQKNQTDSPSAANDWSGDVLIFDQFEEVLLADPADHTGRMAFFEQLGAVLRDRNRWALFAMREEHIAALDPYRRPIPTHFTTTFRLDLLGVNEAEEAIRGPAEDAGVVFPEDLARGLAHDLARVRGVSGSAGPSEGRWVEPVQLQVVCQRIWQELEPDEPAISSQHLAEIGDVDTALRAYYALSVARAAEGAHLRERTLREWIGKELITESGARNQVLWEPGPATAVRDAAVDGLVDAHLLRAERRRDAMWLELAHDRLVGPVLSDNAAWLQQHLQPFQQQAQAWDRSGRSTSMLIGGKALAAAQTWAREPENASEVAAHQAEADFLRESVEAQAGREHARRQRRILAVSVAVAVLALLAGLGYSLILAQRGTQQELSRRLGFDAIGVREREPALSLLLAAEAYDAWDTFEARSALVAALSPEGQPSAEYDASAASLTGLAVSPDGETLAAGSPEGVITLWDWDTRERFGDTLTESGAPISSLAWSPDGRVLAAGDEKGVVWLLAMGDGQLLPMASWPAHTRINDLAFGRGGQFYTLGKDDLILWRLEPDGTAEELARRETPGARALAISPKGDFLVTAHDAGFVLEWALDDDGTPAEQPRKRFEGYPRIARAVAIGDDGKIAAGYEGGLVILWPPPDAADRRFKFMGLHERDVTALAFGPGATWLASSGRDRQVLLWDAEKSGLRLRWRGHTDFIEDLTVTPDGRFIVSAGADGRVLAWPSPGAGQVGAFATQLSGHTDEVWSVAFSPVEGAAALAATGGKDGAVWLWTITEQGAQGRALAQGLAGVGHVAFSTDGVRVAAGDENGKLHVWRLGAPSTSPGGSAQDSGIPDAAPPVELEHSQGAVTGLTFLPDALVAAGEDGQLSVWATDATDAAAPFATADVESPIVGLTRDDQDQLWVLDRDGRISTWEWTSQTRTLERLSLQVPAELAREAVVLASMATRGDGELLAVGAVDGRLLLSEPDRGARDGPWRTSTLTGHTNTASSVAFSPDGSLLASAGWDGQILLWDVATRRQLGVPLRSIGRAISGLAFSPDGHWLAVVSDDRTLILYPTTPEQWVSTACKLAGRRLTEKELERYLGAGGEQQPCPVH